jgi:hypothetical protein
LERPRLTEVSIPMQPKPEEFSEYLTTAEAAQYLKLSRQFLEGARHRADGSGPEYIKLARSVRYRRAALDDWMNRHAQTGPEPVPTAAVRRSR